MLEEEAPLADPLERARAVISVSIRQIAQEETLYRPMLAASLERQAHGSPPSRSIAERAGRMQTVALEAAIEQGLLRSDLDPLLLGRQIYHGYELALQQWALGEIDISGFEARALYGLYVALLAVAEDVSRPAISREVKKIEATLRGEPRARRRRKSA